MTPMASSVIALDDIRRREEGQDEHRARQGAAGHAGKGKTKLRRGALQLCINDQR